MVSKQSGLKLLLLSSLLVVAGMFGTGCEANKTDGTPTTTSNGSPDQLVVYASAGSEKLMNRLEEHHFKIVPLETQSDSAKLVKSLVGATSQDYFIVFNPKFNRVVTSAAITNDDQWADVDKLLSNIEKISTEGVKQLPSLMPEKSGTVRLAIFSDFQCPFCKKLDDKIVQWQQKYGDKLDVLFIQFPLPMHPLSLPAAIASECARAQGKFDAYRVKLFASQEDMKAGKEPFLPIADSLGLKKPDFMTCMHDPATEEKVKEDILFGNYVAVKGTPTFFINGELIDGLSEPQIVQKIDAAMH